MKDDFPKRGSIYWVNLDPTVGAETKKTRPCLIVSCDTGNKNSPLVMVAPITSKVHKVYPFEAALHVKDKACKVMLNQARALDKSRLGKKMGEVHLEEMWSVDKAIAVVFGL
jgi:mRNA interferase MazF